MGPSFGSSLTVIFYAQFYTFCKIGKISRPPLTKLYDCIIILIQTHREE